MPVIEVVGEVIVALVADDEGRLVPVPGGSPANVALALARLGEQVQLHARFGRDALGARCRDHLASNGVGLDHAVAALEPSTLAQATVGEGGAARYDFWTTGTSDWQWSEAELAVIPLPNAVALHSGSIASWTAPGRGPVLESIRTAAATGDVTLSYDPNVRQGLMGPPERARELVEAYVRLVHVVKASDEDVAFLYPDLATDEVLKRWHHLGATLAVMTTGDEGARATITGGVGAAIVPPKVDVVDTVGAGDTFMGALLAALHHRGLLGVGPRERLAGLDEQSLGEVLRWAAGAAAVTCSRQGCNPPTKAEADAMARRRTRAPRTAPPG
jgi:fructokinase